MMIVCDYCGENLGTSCFTIEKVEYIMPVRGITYHNNNMNPSIMHFCGFAHQQEYCKKHNKLIDNVFLYPDDVTKTLIEYGKIINKLVIEVNELKATPVR